MDYKDYYQILGVDRNASTEEIKQKYRNLARQLHPDIKPGDKAAEDRFKEINEAYEVLSDPGKRSKYDQLGANWNQWQRAGRAPGDFDWSQWFSPGGSPQGGVRVDFSDLNDLFGSSSSGRVGGFSDFFNSLFGGVAGAGRERARRGQNLEQPIEITLEEAYSGTSRTLARDGQRIQAKLPAGAKSGTKVRLSGQGAPGAGGARGDLYLKITVKPHPRFERRGDDLHMEVEVDLYTNVLGGEMKLNTLGGDVRLKIPASTQSGQVFRLRGKGMPKLREKGKFGDLYVKVMPRIPKNLSDQEKQLFKQLVDLRKKNPIHEN